ncbi:MAG TPA: DinB family protein, partial [Vicinamibacterales bacterium]|nr:DinB family protein [Vicinamibacterales bacterium]
LETTDAAWGAALERLEQSHADLVAAVRRLEPGRLDRIVGDARTPELGTGLSLSVTLHGLVHHDAYHAGQISMLKRAQAK